jgi:hypothetical protein
MGHAEAMLDGGRTRTSMPAGVASKLMASRSQQSDPHFLAIVATDLEAVGAPTAIARRLSSRGDCLAVFIFNRSIQKDVRAGSEFSWASS